MDTVRLPDLGATRGAADRVVDDQLGAGASLAGHDVVLLARDLASSSASFADQIVKRLLVDADAAAVHLVAAPPKFDAQVAESARRRDRADRVRRSTAAALGV